MKVTDEQKKQVEELMRVGCLALQHGKPLEESHQIGATVLSLIEVVRAVPVPVVQTRKKR